MCFRRNFLYFVISLTNKFWKTNPFEDADNDNSLVRVSCDATYVFVLLRLLFAEPRSFGLSLISLLFEICIGPEEPTRSAAEETREEFFESELIGVFWKLFPFDILLSVVVATIFCRGLMFKAFSWFLYFVWVTAASLHINKKFAVKTSAKLKTVIRLKRRRAS